MNDELKKLIQNARKNRSLKSSEFDDRFIHINKKLYDEINVVSTHQQCFNRRREVQKAKKTCTKFPVINITLCFRIQGCKVESCENPVLFQKLDKDCIYLVNLNYCIKEAYEDKAPAHPFLLNWRSKYSQKDTSSKYSLQHTKAIRDEHIKSVKDEDIFEEKLSVLDPQGLMFIKNSCFHSESYENIATNLIYNIHTSLTSCPQIETVDDVVYYQQINFCGCESEFLEQANNL